MINKVDHRVILAFAVIGGLWVLKLALQWLFWLYLHIICGNDLTKYGAKRNDNRGWALVTGASEGIGYALCKEIASRGMNVIIVSRRESELQKIKNELEGTFSGLKVEYLAADCSQASPASDKITEFVKAFNVTMLVNNVGVESGDPEPYIEKSVDNLEKMINVNVRFSSLITLKVLPLIIENCKKTFLKGAVLNLSSNASILDTPLLTAYTASKEYNRSFSNTLAGEVEIHPLYQDLIDVLCVRPSFVESRMSGLKADDLRGLLLGVATAENFAKSAINKLGHVRDIASYWRHDITVGFLTSLPLWVSQRFMYSLTHKKYLMHQAEARVAHVNLNPVAAAASDGGGSGGGNEIVKPLLDSNSK